MLYEGIEKTNELVEQAISVAIDKKEVLFKQFINAALVFVILLVFGCLDFATLDVHFEYLIMPSYWVGIITKTVAGVCALNVGINIMYDLEIKKNGVLAQNIKRYRELNSCKESDFDYFVEKVYNRALKIKNYIAYINKKIYILNRFSRAQDRIAYNYCPGGTSSDKRTNRYLTKRRQLETLKSDEFIEKNYDSLLVNYKSIDPAIFELEIDGTQKVESVKVRGSVTFGRIKTSASIVLSMVGFSMLVSSFSLGADQQQFANEMVAAAHYCLKAVSDIGVVIWQLFNGMMRTRGIVSSQLTTPFANRVQILKEYYKWRDKQGLPVPVCYKNLSKEVEPEEVIEISESDLKKIKTPQE